MRKFRRLLPRSGIREVFDRASEIEQAGQPVLHLEIGRPDWRLPPGAAEQAHHALDSGLVHYIPNRGLPELREAIAAEVAESIGCRFDPDSELIVTSGASEALSMAALALLGPDDEMIIPEPAWPHYRAVAQMVGATPVPLPLSPEEGFLLDPEKLSRTITPKTRMLIVNTPGNPTGAVQPEDVLREVARLALHQGIYVFSDEVYRQFVYQGRHVSIGSFMDGSEHFLHVDSFSKSYAMTGWRIGYVAARAAVSDAMNRVHQYLTVCGVPFAQKGAAEVLRDPGRDAYLAEMREAFFARYSVWEEVPTSCPAFQCAAPGGAFYLFPRITHQGKSGRELCLQMLEQHQVAMVPGEIFGEAFRDHVRISYGRDLETQRSAAERLTGALDG